MGREWIYECDKKGEKQLVGYGENAFYVRKIPRAKAAEVIKKYHTSGKVVAASSPNFRVWIGGNMLGVLQFGPLGNPRCHAHIVADSLFEECRELNRMWLSDKAQRNSESRAISLCMRLMRYSELEGDLSTMAPEGFQQAYAATLAAAAAHLADHRLMVIITGDVRGEDGSPLSCRIKPARHSVALCPAGREEAAQAANFMPPLGSLPLRTSSSFKAGRKMGRAHQSVQVFLKGCPEQARLVMPTEAQDVLANTA